LFALDFSVADDSTNPFSNKNLIVEILQANLCQCLFDDPGPANQLKHLVLYITSPR